MNVHVYGSGAQPGACKKTCCRRKWDRRSHLASAEKGEHVKQEEP